MSNKKINEQKDLLKEDLIDKLIEKFFDSISKSNQDRFIKAAEKQNPEVAKAFDNVNDTIEKAKKELRDVIRKSGVKPTF